MRTWTRIVIGAVAALVAVAGVATAAFQHWMPWWMDEGDHNHVHSGEVGSQRYQVHLPPLYDGATPLPVIMAIHGCGMSGYGWNSMKSTTQLNDLADREGFIVVYPTQPLFGSVVNCWNSADPREQHRHTGEPALLAGVARKVVETYGADPDQVHVAGASSGAGTAVILAATYPDVFATAMPVNPRGWSTSKEPWVTSWTAVCSTTACVRVHHPTLPTRDGASLVESSLVKDMGHVWPGPAGEGLFTDHAGPDVRAIIWDFVCRHSRGTPE